MLINKAKIAKNVRIKFSLNFVIPIGELPDELKHPQEISRSRK